MKISVIIPVYRVELYLRQCVDSVLHQTYRDLEVILVDDGSPDRCPEICDAYAACDARVRVIHKENERQAMARKSGIEAVTGEYVMFVDGDDWLDLTAVERCVQCIQDNPSLDCVLFSYSKETKDTSIVMHVMDGTQGLSGQDAVDKVHRRLFGLSPEELGHPERMENIVSCCMKLYRADVARNGAYFDTQEVGSCEDGLFNIYALFGCSRMYYLDEPLYHYRKHGNSLTASYHPRFVEQWGRLFSIMEQFIREHQLGEAYTTALNNRIALSITAISLNELKNPEHGPLQQIRMIRAYLHSERYRTAIRQMDLSRLPAVWKLLLLCSRMRWATAVYLGAEAMTWMLRHRR